VLEYRRVSDGIHTRQFLRHPLVYLDHWAFALFSRDRALREEFVAILRARGGSLCLGRLNMLEFSGVSDPEQLRVAEELVQAVLPGVFFLDTAMMPVVERESAGDPGACGDVPFFQDFGTALLDGVEWRASKLFERLAAQRVTYVQAFDVTQRILLHFIKSYADVDAKTLCDGLAEGRKRRRATLGLGRALMWEIHRDKTQRLIQRDASDMMHAIVPCAYCDFVLLDAEWCDFIERARRRLEAVGPAKQHIGRVYSKRRDGVRRFLDDLMAHPLDHRPLPPWFPGSS
jgi:hypothetical protein